MANRIISTHDVDALLFTEGTEVTTRISINGRKLSVTGERPKSDRLSDIAAVVAQADPEKGIRVNLPAAQVKDDADNLLFNADGTEMKRTQAVKKTPAQAAAWLRSIAKVKGKGKKDDADSRQTDGTSVQNGTPVVN